MLCTAQHVASCAQRAPAPRGRERAGARPQNAVGKRQLALHAVAPAAAPRVSDAATAAFMQWLQQGGVDTNNVKIAFFDEGLGFAAAK